MEDCLMVLKELLDINTFDESKDSILYFYLTKAKNAIMKKCLLTEEEYTNSNLGNQTIELARYYYQNQKVLGIKNKSEGTKSMSYEIDDIPTSIKATLPQPPIVSL